MPNKYIIITGTQNRVHMGDDEPTQEDVGIEVMCDVLTIEPSGAITIWKKVNDFRSDLLQAFGPHEWKRVDYLGWFGNEVSTVANEDDPPASNLGLAKPECPECAANLYVGRDFLHAAGCSRAAAPMSTRPSADDFAKAHGAKR